MLRFLFLGLMILVCSNNAAGQTALFSQSGRGEVESDSFTITHPATLIMKVATDSKEIEDYTSLLVELKIDKGDEITTEEIWSLDIAEKKVAEGSVAHRVRVPPGKYFLEISSISEVHWTVELRHDNQKDAYTLTPSDKGFVIRLNDKPVGEAYSEEMAKLMIKLLNGQMN